MRGQRRRPEQWGGDPSPLSGRLQQWFVEEEKILDSAIPSPHDEEGEMKARAVREAEEKGLIVPNEEGGEAFKEDRSSPPGFWRAREEVDESAFVFNRVHKTGSVNFVFMMQKVADRGGRFRHFRSAYYPDKKMVRGMACQYGGLFF